MNQGAEARRYLRHHHHGVLSTLSKKLDGYPFGSIVPFVLDHAARPALLISRLAEHTKNVDADPRVSLLVHTAGADVQAATRLTLIGNAARVSDDSATLAARYLRYVPDAERLQALGDFFLYRIEPLTLRFIGGFGDIQWIAAATYAPAANTIAECEADIIAHMNTGHAAVLRDCCRHFKHNHAATVTMIGVDCDGFDVRADGTLLRFDFAAPIADAHKLRAELAALARDARA
jgi:heme oxygenase (biliverdin-IX-beta and delta-forming)